MDKEKEIANTTEPEEEVTTEFEQGYDVGYSDAIEDMRGLLKRLENTINRLF